MVFQKIGWKTCIFNRIIEVVSNDNNKMLVWQCMRLDMWWLDPKSTSGISSFWKPKSNWNRPWQLRPSENPKGWDTLRYVEIRLCRWQLPRSAQINTKYPRNIVNWNLNKIICHFYNFLTSISESTFSIMLLSCFSTSSMADLAQSLACEATSHITGLTPFDFSSHQLFPSLHYVYIMNGSHHRLPPSESLRIFSLIDHDLDLTFLSCCLCLKYGVIQVVTGEGVSHAHTTFLILEDQQGARAEPEEQGSGRGSREVQDRQQREDRQQGGTGQAAGRSRTGSGREWDGKHVVPMLCRVVLHISTDEYRYCQIDDICELIWADNASAIVGPLKAPSEVCSRHLDPMSRYKFRPLPNYVQISTLTSGQTPLVSRW